MKRQIELSKFKELFYKRKLPNKEIAKFFEVGESAVGSFRHRYNLPPRGWSKPPWQGKKRSLETRIKIGKSLKGKHCKAKNHNWKGGRYKTPNGYIMILKPKHQGSNKQGYIPEHRFIMEKYLKCPLKTTEIVHHINGIGDDNRISNLIVFNRSAHCRFHYPPGSKFGVNHN